MLSFVLISIADVIKLDRNDIYDGDVVLYGDRQHKSFILYKIYFC
jgi:hypothetical protein